jgi:hypothetical protein
MGKKYLIMQSDAKGGRKDFLDLLSPDFEQYLTSVGFVYYGEEVTSRRFIERRINTLGIYKKKCELLIELDADFDEDYLIEFLKHVFDYLKKADLYDDYFHSLTYRKT